MSNLLIWHDGRTIGPYTLDEICSYLGSGHLTSNSLAWTEGLSDWTALGDVISVLNERGEGGAAPEFTDLGHRVLVPDGVRGFSWGAMCIAPIWAVGNRVWIGLLSLIPGLGQLVMVWLGFHGRELAWRRHSWPSVQAFQQSQRRWSFGGLVCMSLVGLLFAAMLASRSAAPSAAAPRDRVSSGAREAAPDKRAVSRKDFETRLSGKTPIEVERLAGRPAYVREQRGVLIYIYRDVTLKPGSHETDDAAVVGFTGGRAKIFEFVQEKNQ